LKRNIITTADGSKTIQIEEWNEQYHSVHGAIQEAYHVFIKHGLYYFKEFHSNLEEPISILEIGFGTGLNAFITLIEAEKLNVDINYVGVEAYPVSMDEIQQLNYPTAFNAENKADLFDCLHTSAWNKKIEISKGFELTKQQKSFFEIEDINAFNIIYFDAFGARVQPELWTEALFKKMFDALKLNGVLVTYSAKGSVRRAMLEVGFKVEKLPGPPGKREMLRATKHSTTQN
jgi:tRNA U34 5-methylaminomethyl-2-thiouridine-forming methyltransferase MnmC